MGFLALTIAATSSLYVTFRRKASATELTTGAFLLCMALLVLIYFLAPGTSFLLMWLLLSLCSLGLEFVLDRPDSKLLKIALLICAGVPVFLFTLLIADFAILEPGSTQTMVSLCVFTVVLLALLSAQLEVMTARRRWLLPGACAAIGLSFTAFGALHSGYDT